MKKILIVNNNLDMGGIQKSLVNLLNGVQGKYNITLLLFSKSGALLKDVPDRVNIITPNHCYRMLGMTKDELKGHPLLFFWKFLLMKYAGFFSRRSAMRLLGLFQKKINGFDMVISYSHLPHHKYFGNGCGDFVLDKVICSNKLCLVHCDYLHSGYMTEENNREYVEFDKIACCSDSVRSRFLEGSRMSPDKVFTLRNFYDFNIISLAEDAPYVYEQNCVNLLTVARLSYEKGIDKAVDALFASGRSDIKYFIIGDGPQRSRLQEKIKEYRMEKQVLLLGEQQNPYRYMLHADYLLVPSLHEAAPMVFDEANLLGLPILSTNTTSAQEMVSDNGGIVCEDFSELESILKSLKRKEKKRKLLRTNEMQLEQFSHLENE